MNYHPTSSLYAAHLITTILNTPSLTQEWQVKTISYFFSIE